MQTVMHTLNISLQSVIKHHCTCPSVLFSSWIQRFITLFAALVGCLSLVFQFMFSFLIIWYIFQFNNIPFLHITADIVSYLQTSKGSGAVSVWYICICITCDCLHLLWLLVELWQVLFALNNFYIASLALKNLLFYSVVKLLLRKIYISQGCSRHSFVMFC